jgi:ABC-type branched-subunit amino acid transport system ATPase component
MLELINLKKSFGGLTAVNNVSFRANRESITAIIGPNGAGKTTLFNIISGFFLPNEGKILFEGKDITGFHPHQVCYLGITRTFQNLQIFQNMTVMENVMVGYHMKTSSGFLSSMVRTRHVKREEEDTRKRTKEILALFNLTNREIQQGSSLAFGDQKRLELARALVSHPKMILLDEPAAGLNTYETEELAKFILKQRESGIAIVLVEHDMNLVMEISDFVIVLNYGEKIAEGTPREIQNNQRVITAYLGNY